MKVIKQKKKSVVTELRQSHQVGIILRELSQGRVNIHLHQCKLRKKLNYL